MHVDAPVTVANAFVERVWGAVSRACDSLLFAQRKMSHDADKAWHAEQPEVRVFVLLST